MMFFWNLHLKILLYVMYMVKYVQMRKCAESRIASLVKYAQVCG
jgi:hypothetical protein